MIDNDCLRLFSKEVFTYLIDNDIPASPENYEYYFNELLVSKSYEVQENLKFFKNIDKNSNLEKFIVLNNSLKKGFNSIRKLYSLSNSLSSNTAKVSSFIDNKLSDNNNKSLKNLLNKFSSILKSHNLEMKKIEENFKQILFSIKENNIYDELYNVFNRKYIISLINKEIETMEAYKHPVSILFLRLKDIEKINIAQKRIILNKFLSKTLSKTARNSDYIGYLGEDIFVMVLVQTDIKNAKLAKKRISNLIRNSNLYINDKEIILDINIKDRFLTRTSNIEEFLMTINEELS